MCDLSDFDPKCLFKTDCTVFVRKLNGKDDWDPREEIPTNHERAEHCYSKAFEDDQDRISVFAVSSSTELARIAIAMNATPGRSRTEKIDLAWFTEADFQSHGLIINQVMGDTNCGLANSLHYEIIDNRNKVISLIETAMNGGRTIVRHTKSKLKMALKSATSAGCYSIAESTPNQCECGF